VNVFITGATGFVGRNLVDYLSAAYPELALYCLARNPEKAREIERPGVFIVPGDLHTPESYTSSVAQADIILHLAAMVGLKNGEAFYTANRDATQTLVNAAKHSERLKRFFYLSSIAAIDRPVPPASRNRR
jgi:nucleoside-diphosphate-sugar epimerase